MEKQFRIRSKIILVKIRRTIPRITSVGLAKFTRRLVCVVPFISPEEFTQLRWAWPSIEKRVPTGARAPRILDPVTSLERETIRREEKKRDLPGETWSHEMNRIWRTCDMILKSCVCVLYKSEGLYPEHWMREISTFSREEGGKQSRVRWRRRLSLYKNF